MTLELLCNTATYEASGKKSLETPNLKHAARQCLTLFWLYVDQKKDVRNIFPICLEVEQFFLY